MIDNVSVRVQDFSRLLAFFREALAPIGYQVIMEYPGAVGLGADGKPDLWLMQTEQPINPTHVALVAPREKIDAFHSAAIFAGGVDNGPPGLRADYHPHYYAAFVRDPEGNNIEVVWHLPPGAPTAAKPKATAKTTKPKPKVKAKVKASAKPAKKGSKKAAKKKPAKKAGKKR